MRDTNWGRFEETLEKIAAVEYFEKLAEARAIEIVSLFDEDELAKVAADPGKAWKDSVMNTHNKPSDTYNSTKKPWGTAAKERVLGPGKVPAQTFSPEYYKRLVNKGSKYETGKMSKAEKFMIPSYAAKAGKKAGLTPKKVFNMRKTPWYAQ